MKKNLVTLIRISQIDGEIFGCQQELASLPEKVVLCATELEKVQSTLSQAKRTIEDLELSRRNNEGEIKMEETRMRRSQGRILAVKKTDEYQAVAREVAQSKKMISELEDATLDMMQKIEEQQKLAGDLEGKRVVLEEQLSARQAEVQTKAEVLRGGLVQLAGRRKQLVDEVSAQALTQYEKILQRLQPAMALVVSGICQGCNTRIPPQFLNELLRMEKLFQCPRCFRMLYLEDQLTQVQASQVPGPETP